MAALVVEIAIEDIESCFHGEFFLDYSVCCPGADIRGGGLARYGGLLAYWPGQEQTLRPLAYDAALAGRDRGYLVSAWQALLGDYSDRYIFLDEDSRL